MEARTRCLSKRIELSPAFFTVIPKNECSARCSVSEINRQNERNEKEGYHTNKDKE